MNPSMLPYQICSRCIMDTTDPEITFDSEGVCSHCHLYERKVKSVLWDKVESEKRLARLVEEMKKAGEGKDYDCVIGVSGGVDSTYVAYLVKKLGLRPLAVHLDNGWNSTQAVTNIERTLKMLDIDLYTEVLDWEEFKDLQLSFIKASTPDLEIPTDHAIIAVLLQFAAKHRIRYIISGTNIRTEAIMPRSWSQGYFDWEYIKGLNKKFGTVPLRTFPHFTLLQYILARTIKKQQWVNILDYIDYSKEEAMKVLQKDLGWVYYGGKHYESIYTRFFQSYILPVKFNADKRRAHLSTLICSGEITREHALEEISKPICPEDLLIQDKQFVVKKLGLTEAKFDELMNLPNKSIADYPAYENTLLFKGLRGLFRIPGRIRLLRSTSSGKGEVGSSLDEPIYPKTVRQK